MNWLDAVIAVPLLFGAWKGWKRGLLFEIAMIIGLIIALYIGFKFSGFVSDWLSNHVDQMKGVTPYLSFFLIFAIIILSFILLARLLENVLKLTGLSLFNQIGGSLFGLLKFGLILSVLLWMFKSVERDLVIIPVQVRERSLLYEPVLKTASFVRPLLQDVKKEFNENIGK